MTEVDGQLSSSYKLLKPFPVQESASALHGLIVKLSFGRERVFSAFSTVHERQVARSSGPGNTLLAFLFIAVFNYISLGAVFCFRQSIFSHSSVLRQSGPVKLQRHHEMPCVSTGLLFQAEIRSQPYLGTSACMSGITNSTVAPQKSLSLGFGMAAAWTERPAFVVEP